MARISTELSAFLVPDRRATVDYLLPRTEGGGASESTFTQAGPRPGTAIPADPRSGILPRVHAAQDLDLAFYANKGGDPGIDGASWLYRKDSDLLGGEYRSWNEPNRIECYLPVEWTTTSNWERLDAVTVPSTGAVVVVGVDTAGAEVASSWTYTPSTRTWGARVDVDIYSTATRIPAVVVMPGTERVLAFFIIPGGGSTVAFQSYYSDDAGVTWALHERDMFPSTSPTGAIDDITAEVDRYGNILLVCTDTATGDWWTFRSTDGGAYFVVGATGTAWGDRPCLRRMASGSLLLSYRTTGVGLDAKTIVLADAYDSPTGKTGVAINSTTDCEYVRVVVDDDGICYALITGNIAAVTADRWTVARSLDEGVTWTAYTYGAMQSVNSKRHYAKALAASGGELVALANPHHPVTAPTTDYSIMALHLGGWSNVEADSLGGVATRTSRFGYGYDGASTTDSAVYLPGELLANQGWTHTGAAAARTNGYHVYTTTGAAISDLLTHAATANRMTVYVEFSVASGGVLTALDAGFRIRRANGVYDFQLEIRGTTTGFRVADGHGGTIDDVTLGMSADLVQLLIYFGAPGATLSATVFYKLRSSSTWTYSSEGSLVDGGALAATNAVEVGGITAATATCRFGMISWVDGGTLNDIADGGFSKEKMRWGKALTSAPYPIRDRVSGANARMCRVSAAGARARYSETFRVPAVYDYGIDQLFPDVAPSPQVGWRSTQAAANEQLVFDFGVDTRFDHGWTMALGFFGPGVPRKITVQRKTTAAGAYTSLGTYDGATGFSAMNYQLDGDILKCRVAVPGTAGARHCWEGEWSGGYVVLDPGGTDTVRRVAWSTAGRWGATTGLPVMELRLLGIDGSEAATGTVHLVHPGGVFVIPQAAETVFRYLKVQVLNEPQPEAYYSIPVMAIGSCLVPGKQFGPGWTMRHVPRARVSEDEYGTTWAEKRGPVRRELTWSYQDGVDLYGVRSSLTPDYVQLHSSLPVEAAYGDAESRIAGMLATSRGGAVPVVALLRMPAISTETTITDPSIVLYGRLTGSLQSAQVVGKGGVGEHKRIESMSIVELPWDYDP